MDAVKNVLLVAYLLIVLAMIAVILLQRSEGGGLGIGGNTGGLMTVRGQANLLTRTTAVLAALFFASAIGLALLGFLDRGNDVLANAPVAAIGGASSAASAVAPARVRRAERARTGAGGHLRRRQCAGSRLECRYRGRVRAAGRRHHRPCLAALACIRRAGRIRCASCCFGACRAAPAASSEAPIAPASSAPPADAASTSASAAPPTSSAASQ